jgi:hypothetical protein
MTTAPNQACAEVFDYFERFHNSTLRLLDHRISKPIQYEENAIQSYVVVNVMPTSTAGSGRSLQPGPMSVERDKPAFCRRSHRLRRNFSQVQQYLMDNAADCMKPAVRTRHGLDKF